MAQPDVQLGSVGSLWRYPVKSMCEAARFAGVMR
jgi:hypothetical protein